MIAPVLSLVLLATVEVGAGPRVELREGTVVVRALPPVLAHEAVRKHLVTGLTTTLVVEVDLRTGRGRRFTGVAHIGVRWDLWEEKFLLSVKAFDGESTLEVGGEAALDSWWSVTSLTVLGPPAVLGVPLRATVRLTILPFSHAEEEDTRSWFLRSLQRDSRGAAAAAPGDPSVKERTGLSEVYDALMATSIGRRSLLTFTWEVPVVEGSP